MRFYNSARPGSGRGLAEYQDLAASDFGVDGTLANCGISDLCR